jgi:serine/threonine-protein kinase
MATQGDTLPPLPEALCELLLRWQELRNQGQKVTAEELCADCPELAEELKQQIGVIQSMEGLLGLEKDTVVEPSARAGQQAEAEPGRIPGYEILGVLGQGGMGVVYRARQVPLDRPVALKMMLEGPHAQPEQRARFRTEAEAVARLRHPNIVQIYEVGECAGQPYFSMEFVEGGSLAQKLAGAVLPARQAAQWVETLAEAVHAAHLRGIVHRDLKPANVLLQIADCKLQIADLPETPPTKSAICNLQSAIPKITDFGLAKRLDSADGQTQTGAILGTPSYVAPEQAEGKRKEIGPPADIYALGAILYEMLTGRPPFQGESILDTLEQVRFREPVPPSRLRPKVPHDLETICLKCLQKEPHKRYASAQELADDLRRFLTGEPIRARRTPLWEQGVKWAKSKPALAALLTVSAVAAAFLLGGWIGFTAELRAERNRALQEKERAERQEQVAKDNQRSAEKERAEAERQRDVARRTQRILHQSLAAIDDLAHATEEGIDTKLGGGGSGSINYIVACSYAVTSGRFRNDTELLPNDRKQRAEEWATRAVQSLKKAQALRYFNKRANRDKLKHDSALDPLRSRPDFQELLRNVKK